MARWRSRERLFRRGLFDGDGYKLSIAFALGLFFLAGKWDNGG